MLGNPKKHQESSLIAKEANAETDENANEEEIDEGDIELSHVIATIETMDDQFLHAGGADFFTDSRNSDSASLEEDIEDNFDLCQFVDDENFAAAPGISQDN